MPFPITPSALLRPSSARRAGQVLVAATLILAAGGCGKKGPPLAPLLRVPAQVSAFQIVRTDDLVFATLTVPATNVGGDQPADVALVEVYGVTSVRPPTLENGRVPLGLSLVASAPVRRPTPPLPPALPNAPALPPLPLEPGLDQGAVATFREVLTPELARESAAVAPVTPARAPAVAVVAHPALSLPLVFASGTTTVRRHYTAVAVSRQGRRGAWSEVRSVPISAPSGPPSAPAATFDAVAIALTWTPASDARQAPAAPADGALDSRPFGPVLPATRYNLYAADAPATAVAAATSEVSRPLPLNEAPLAAPAFGVSGVTFNAERCFVVRGLDTIDGVEVEGPASPASCVTPRDTFAPPAPAALEAVAGAGVISLIWEAVDASDLAGYLVFRGPAPGEPTTLLTPVPIGATSFEDRTVTPGVRYVYVVVAVDSATPENRSVPSNRSEESARR